MKSNDEYVNYVKFVAHRGYSMKAPENTLPAFELAGQAGFWGIELDTYCTADGHWIVHHDRTLNRMTNGRGAVHKRTFAEIKQLHIRAGAEIEKYQDLKIPSLEEVLEISSRHGMHAFVEVKGFHSDEDLRRLVQIIRDKQGEDRCSVIDFEADHLQKIRALTAQLTLGYLKDKKPLASDISFLRDLGNTFMNCNHAHMTVNDVHFCHEHGVEISIWTVNDRLKAEPFIAAGVDYITTDTNLHQQLNPSS